MYLYLGSMYEIEKFENGPLSIEVRTLYIEGVVWFVLTDLARALGYRDASAARHLLRSSQYVQADEAIKQALGIRGRAPYLVNESGFYRLAMQSSKAEAEPFQLWVEDEVLPTIRKARSVGIDALEEMKGRIQQRTAELESKIKGADNYRRQLEKEIPAAEARHREEVANLYIANKAMHLIEDDLHEILIDMEKQGAKLPRKPMTHAEARKRARES